MLLAEPFVALLEGSGARDRPRLFVGGEAGGVLAVGLVPAEESERDKGTSVGRFSVSSGDLLWEWRAEGSYMAVPVAHRGWFPVLHRYGDRLSVLDPADGRVVARCRLRGSGFDPVFAVADDVIAVNGTAIDDTRRTRVFRRR